MRPLVYVIMPVGSDPDAGHRRERIAATADALGLDTYFPLDHRTHGEDVDPATLRLEMQRATIAVADLSLERPSCYYELGVALGVGLPTVVVAAAGTPIHQTADRASVAFYDSLDGLGKILEDRLRPFAYSPVR
ncbi:MAG TPA: hypothetical protein VE132_15515 [Micromonosporaceae bacterium]|jgi:nucleoside 2-deoxyribosyltransferase|nr:hypothetical protein [Micromonosporaceae bacterium]